MKPATFPQPFEQAIAQAFEIHRQANCPPDCGFCFDLILSGTPTATAELNRIRNAKDQRSRAVTQPKRVGKGKKSPLAGRVKR